MKRVIGICTLGLVFLMTACKNDGCDQPYAFNYDPNGTTSESCVYAPVTMEVNFIPMFNDEAFPAALPAAFTMIDGRSISFEHFGIYLTEFAIEVGGEFQNVDASKECLDRRADAHLLTNDTRTFAVDVLPEKDFEITGIRFNVGVDTCRNNALDPTTQLDGPFQPQNPTMFWSWASGYRFVSMDGRVDASAAADSTLIAAFEYHTGLNQLLRTVTLQDVSTELIDGVVSIDVSVDFASLLNGLDFTVDHSTHTSDNLPLATKITDNVESSFYLHGGNEMEE